jgi:hypothetical protein
MQTGAARRGIGPAEIGKYIAQIDIVWINEGNTCVNCGINGNVSAGDFKWR